MRLALLRATFARHELQVSGPRPLRARSWLMSACCVEPMTIAGGAGRGGSAATCLGGGGGGVGLSRGIMRCGAVSLAFTRSFGPNEIRVFAAVRACVGVEWVRTTDVAPAAIAITTTSPASQDRNLMTG